MSNRVLVFFIEQVNVLGRQASEAKELELKGEQLRVDAENLRLRAKELEKSVEAKSLEVQQVQISIDGLNSGRCLCIQHIMWLRHLFPSYPFT